MAEYTPTDEDMRKRHRHAWEQSPVNRHALDEADAQWSRWLAAHDARIRREAAREALDGYADALNRNRSAAVWDWPDFVGDVREWASYNYPEQEQS